MKILRYKRALALGATVCIVLLGCEKRDEKPEPAQERPASSEAVTAEPTRDAARQTASPDMKPSERAPANHATGEPASSTQTTQPAVPAISPHSATPTNMPPGHPNIARPEGSTPDTAASWTGPELVLDGLAMTVPDGWTREPVKAGRLAAEAAFRLPKAEGDTADAMVRITYFPNMKGMDEMNINRWLAQVRRPDGQSSTRDDATMTVTEMDSIRLTVIDVTGVVNVSIDGSGQGVPDHRLIGAILDHANGPHFVKAFGGLRTVEQWQESIYAFLKTARIP